MQKAALKTMILLSSIVLTELMLQHDAKAQIFGQSPPVASEQRTAPRRVIRNKVRRPVYQAEPKQEVKPLQSTLKFDASLGDIFQSVHQKAQMITEIAKKENDHLLFKIGADFELYLSNWEKNHLPQMSRDAKASEASIQKFLSDADVFLSNITNKRTTSQSLNIEESLNRHEEIIATMPTVKHLPQVFSYSPYLIQPLSQKKVVISVKTLSFSYGKPKLNIGSVAYEPSNESGGVWSFEIDTSSLKNANEETSIIKADLEVSKPKDNSNDIEIYKIPLNLMILPAKTGSYSLEYSYIETVPKFEIKSLALTHASKAIENECKDFTQTATGQGRVIKNISEIYQGGELGSSVLIKATTTDFTVKLCTKRQNKPQMGFPPGVQNSIWQWEEHWFDYQEKIVKLENEIPSSSQELLLETHPTKMQRFTLTVKGNDNREYKFNGSAEKGLFSVKFNPSTKTITLSPRTGEARLN